MRKSSLLNKILTPVSILLILLVLVWADKNLDAFQNRLVFLWGVNTIFTVSFVLIYGHAGQFSLAHAGLACIGAYTMSLLTISPEAKTAMFILKPPVWPISVIQLPFIPALIIAGLMAAAIGFIIGAPALRLFGDYFCMATLGFSELIRLALANLPEVSNGAMGLRGIPRTVNLVEVWALAALTIFVIKRLTESSYGRAIKVVRDDEIAAESVGVNLFYHKTLAFVISAFFVGIGGALMAQLVSTIDPKTFTSALTYSVITMAVLGGLSSITGATIAAGIYTLMSEVLRTVESPRVILGFEFPGIPGMRTLIFSVMLLLLILFYRRGLMGTSEFSWDSILAKIRLFLVKTKVIKPKENVS